MKRNILLFAAVSCIMTAACTKAVPDGFRVEDPEQYAIIYLGSAFHGNMHFTMQAGADTTLNIYANYSGLLDLEQSVAVTFDARPELVETYNASMQTAYKTFPMTNYLLNHRTVTIAAGHSNSDAMTIDLSAKDLTGKGPYMLPVSIVSVSNDQVTVNEDLRTLYVIVQCDDSAVTFENYDRTGWKVVDYTSCEEGHGPEAVLDDDLQTYWAGELSLEESADTSLVHSLTVDMRRHLYVHGLEITSRVRSFAGSEYHYAGQPAELTVEVSEDNLEWVSVAESVSMPFGIESSVRFENYIKGRYLRLTVGRTWLTKNIMGSYLSFSELKVN